MLLQIEALFRMLNAVINDDIDLAFYSYCFHRMNHIHICEGVFLISLPNNRLQVTTQQTLQILDAM